MDKELKNYTVGPLLRTIDTPEDIRKLKLEQLSILAAEVRQYIIDVVSDTGNGHFGANLGTVEMTVALHYVFNTPYDLLVWDVGHQAYGHKILTGRKDAFPNIRKKGGISGFPSREESEYDAFGVGHSSTSISAVLGMAVADRYKGITDRHHIAVIGDGAMTAGLAFEGLNHAGFEKDTDLLVVLNDNCMSIDPNVGALKEYLVRISKSYEGTNLFEALDFKYYGPVDGHDMEKMVTTLQELKAVKGPKILHCITKKGKGYKYSEEGNPTEWHAPGVFNKTTGEKIRKKVEDSPLKYQEVFGYTLLELAQKNKAIVGVTPAMPTGSSLDIMMKALPDRTFDVGIAEQHAVTFSAGLATQGLLPFCAIYSTFMQRAMDQLIHDVALQNLNVVFCLDRAGIVGADGATHHGVFDIALARSIPNVTIASPMNESELRNLMYSAQYKESGPYIIRYPRGKGVQERWKMPFEYITPGKGRKIIDGEDCAVLSIGHTGNFVKTAIEELKNQGISVAHYDMRFVRPLDIELLQEVFSKFDKIVTLENGVVKGGFGSAILEFAAQNSYLKKVVCIGIRDEFIHHGTQEELLEENGVSSNGIIAAVQKLIKA